MGSVTDASQIDLDVALEGRNEQYRVHHAEKAKARAEIESPEIHESKHSCPRA